jgi:aspartate/methionine/tyrosine aminotransferase
MDVGASCGVAAMRRPGASGRGVRTAPFLVMDVLAQANRRAAAGDAVFHLEIGEPGGGPPEAVRAAAARALATAPLGYTEAAGLPELRRRLARHYAETHGVAVDPERILLTAGASGAFVLAFLAAFEPGDRVALATPCYPAYRNILEALGIEAVLVPGEAADGFQPTPALLDRVPGPLHGLVIASPANPTGTMLRPAAQAALVAWARARQVRLVADEIYHGVTYASPATTALAAAPEVIVVNSFSKFFAMTGWRLGWLVVPPELVEPVTRLAQNLFIAPSTIAQHAALGAFDATAELTARVRGYGRARDRLIAALATAGLAPAAPPDGAFYLYLDVARYTADAVAFARRVLDATGVAITPGVDFDPDRGRHHVRLAFAGPEAAVEEAGRRLARLLGPAREVA